jgi:hypothetical protein
MFMDTEKKGFVHKSISLNARYEVKGITSQCMIVDITGSGLTLRANGFLKERDSVKILFEKHIIPVIVMKVNGNITETVFDKLPEAELTFIIDLILSRTPV